MEKRRNYSFKIYVVSLVNETKRRESIKRQLDNLDLKWEFHDAIDARRNPDVVAELYDKNLDLSPRPLTTGEIACAASHLELYKKIIEDDSEIAVILEDDAILTENAERFIKNLENFRLGNFDILIIGYSKLRRAEEKMFYRFEPISKIASVDGVSFGEPWRNWTCGTVGYVISKSGAAKMTNDRVSSLADDWCGNKRKFGLRILHARPLLVFEDFENLESSLHASRVLVQKYDRKYLNGLRLIRGYIRYFFINTDLGRYVMKLSKT